jgi:hypothetical protein
VFGAPSAFASDDPHRYDERRTENRTLPDIPPGYTTKNLKHYKFIYPEGAESLIEPLLKRAEPLRLELTAVIGVDPRPVTTVILARNAAEFQAMQPGGRLPDWVAGVAYSDLNLVLLRQAGSHGQPIDLYKTFEHEMSHIILRQAVPDGELPRWFVEGLAQWQAREFDLERSLRLAKAALQGRLIPLEDLVTRFPAGTLNVRLAYDQSFDLINFLIGEYGQQAFQSLVKRLGSGETFAKAAAATYFMSMDELEDKWRGSLKMTYNWIPLLTSGGAIWTFAAILFLVGYVRTRRRKTRLMAQWEAEERERDEAVLRAQQMELERRLSIFPGRRTDDDDEPMIH